MSQYYNPKRTRNLYIPMAKESFRVSRSKVDLFLECPKCFYLDRRLGVARPPGYPFSLNSAVDALLKKEFDAYREKGIAHHLMKEYGVDAVPFQHEKMNEWRDSLRGGVVYLHEPTNFLFGNSTCKRDDNPHSVSIRNFLASVSRMYLSIWEVLPTKSD